MNDAVLAALLNLFALISARNKSPLDKCVKIIDNYLGADIGLRNKRPYIDLFTDFVDLHEMQSEADDEVSITPVCEGLKSKLEGKDLMPVILRLLEFYRETTDHFNRNNELIIKIAKQLNTEESLYQQFCDFVECKPSETVRIQTHPGYDGYFCTLWLEKDRVMVFCYYGNDQVLLEDIPLRAGEFEIWHRSGVLKNHKGAPIYRATMLRVYQDTQKQETISFCGRDINFKFPNSDNGMHNFSFNLHSGELVAIMGGSGTGKTTLLSLLNGTLEPQQGSITLNGHDTHNEAVQRLIGFVPQDDLLVEELTVYQNLYYTARLCFDGMSEEEIKQRVITVLNSLEMESIKDLKVGSPLNKTISGGQRKRLNIALELIREPTVLMLDEPTSGLSSADTEHVMGLLKQQTYKGRLVIVIIHQPSSSVYKLFSRLWLLDKGGYPVFDGNPIEAITHFKKAANYADAETSTCPLCGNISPELLLNIIDEKTIDSTGKISSLRKKSPKDWHELYLKQRGTMENVDTSDIPHSDQNQPDKIRQFLIQLERNVKTKITNKQYLLITLLSAPLLAIICSWLTRYAPESGYTIMDNKNFVSFLFMAVIVSIFTGMSGSAEEIIRDRSLLKREKFLHLSYSSYISSKVVLMAVVSLIQTFLFVLLGQAIMGYHDLFLKWWLILFVTSFVANLIGLLLSQCLNTVVAIYITIPILLIPQILLCGLVVDFSDLNSKSTTNNVPLIGDVIPSRWAFEALAVTTFTDNEYEAPLFKYHQCQYQDEYTQASFLYELDSQLETLHDEIENGKPQDPKHMAIIKSELPRLTQFCEDEPYQGNYDYQSLKTYMKKCDKIISKRSNQATLDADKIVTDRIKEIGRDKYRKIRTDHYNLKLESVVINDMAPAPYEVIKNKIVARMGQIYLAPVTRDGRAPFYSSYKQLGHLPIKTLWFNLSVLLIMAIVLGTLIYTDFLGRYIRKN